MTPAAAKTDERDRLFQHFLEWSKGRDQRRQQ
jgi:hypothetical protein